jgi:hypothetical protein
MALRSLTGTQGSKQTVKQIKTKDMTLKRKKNSMLFLACMVALLTSAVQAQTPYAKKTARIMTPWGEDLQATDPILPEYPRPQMVREKWLNLNGIWQFQPATSATEALPAGQLAKEILVPFPVESALSGIMEHYDHLWYRRSFTVPADWEGQRVLLHFGAVDYSCEVFINGASAGTHQGGYDPFYIDITDKLQGSGAQDLALRVTDLTDYKGFPRGKQTLYPGGIMYTSVTGIWQTVWLEPVPQKSIATFRMAPDIDNAQLKFYPDVRGNYRFKIYDNGIEIVNVDKNGVSTTSGTTLDIPTPVKLWSPDSPFLYDMKIFFLDGTTILDSVSTYFGMRKISKKEVDGYHRMALNNEALFQMGPLDQGFWPDGIYTAPTDEALRFDIEKMKELGFNMVRKHIKVEPQRWYYWADKLGILVWQDMPSMNSYVCTECLDREGNRRTVPEREDAAYIRELEQMVRTHWNAPSIVSWVSFNEFQGSHIDQSWNPLNVVNRIKIWDNTRLVNINSGGDSRYDDGPTDVRDYHNYASPPSPPESFNHSQVLVCGEYGGIGYEEPGHFWQSGNPYSTVTSYEALLAGYTFNAEALIYYKSNKGVSAAVYTEITDVEMELNGLITYDRKVIKGNASDFYNVNQRIITEEKIYNEFLPTSEITPQSWRYTTTRPASTWFSTSFDDSSWNTGNGGFGTENTPGAIIGTVWNTGDIWLRRKFTLPAGALATGKVVLKVHHDENCKVYINNVPALDLTGYTGSYSFYDITSGAKSALIEGGENTLAVTCHQTAGGQYIDAGVAIQLNNQGGTAVKTPKKNPCYLYPNPVKNTLNIVRQGTNIAIKGIYSVAGSLVKAPAAHDSAVDVSDLAQGTYFIKMQTGSASYTLAFVKE